MNGKHRIITADVLAGLASMDADSIQCVCTSPPYWGLRDYGDAGQIGLESTPDEYVARMVEVFAAVRRVLRADGVVFLNLGDSYASNTARGPQGESGQRADRTFTASVNPKGGNGLKPKDLCMIPARVALALQADGWWLRSDIIWAKPNPMPESCTDRPTSAHEHIYLLTKSASYYWDQEAVRESNNSSNPVSSKEYRDAIGRGSGCNELDRWSDAARSKAIGNNPSGRNCRNVWTIPTQAYPEAHFATYPEELVRRCVAAGSADGDTVLDPFMGSGTTLAVACRMGRDAIGIELSAEYVKLAERRIGTALNPSTYVDPNGGDAGTLFADAVDG